MSNVPNQPARVSTEEERADTARRTRASMQRLHPAPPLTAEQRIAQLEQLVEELRQDLLDLDNRLFDEVRTRRLVVIDDDDAERIVAECRPLAGRPAEVRVSAAFDDDTWVGLHASNGMEDDTPVAELDISVDGTIHTQLCAAPVSGFWQPPRPDYVSRTDTLSRLLIGGEHVLSGYSDRTGSPRRPA